MNCLICYPYDPNNSYGMCETCRFDLSALQEHMRDKTHDADWVEYHCPFVPIDKQYIDQILAYLCGAGLTHYTIVKVGLNYELCSGFRLQDYIDQKKTLIKPEFYYTQPV